MLNEPSSLAKIVYLIGDTLRTEHDIDPLPIYRELGIDPEPPTDPGARQPNSVVRAMWQKALEACGDPALGIQVGRRTTPSSYFVLSHAWMASDTLADAMRVLIRYEEILDSGITDIRFEKVGDCYILSETYPNPADYMGELSVDSAIAQFTVICSVARGAPVVPRKLELMKAAGTPVGIYAGLVDGPIVFAADRNAMHFSAEDFEAPLPGAIPDVVKASSQIAERYIAGLDSDKVAHQVRELLVQTLPSGRADQDNIASMLHRSSSTLQRQLSSEGTTYRSVLETTRRELSEAYLRENKHTQSQIAFLVGFSDQSNFARAFKRWTGVSPGEYQKSTDAAG